MKVWTDFGRVRVRTEIRCSSSILLVYDKRVRACDWEVT